MELRGIGKLQSREDPKLELKNWEIWKKNGDSGNSEMKIRQLKNFKARKLDFTELDIFEL